MSVEGDKKSIEVDLHKYGRLFLAGRDTLIVFPGRRALAIPQYLCEPYMALAIADCRLTREEVIEEVNNIRKNSAAENGKKAYSKLSYEKHNSQSPAIVPYIAVLNDILTRNSIGIYILADSREGYRIQERSIDKFLSGCWELNPVFLRPERSVIPIHYTPMQVLYLEFSPLYQYGIIRII